MPDELEKPTGADHPPLTETSTPFPADKPADSEPGLFGKIGGAVASVAEKHGLTFKRGRGRPKKDGSPGKADLLVNPATGETVPAAAAPPALSAAVPADNSAADRLFHRAIIGGAKGVIRALGDYCRSLARQAGIQPDWIQKHMAAAEPEPNTLADFSESLKMVLEKHNVRTENAAEISLAIHTGRILAPYGIMIFELRREIDRRGAGVFETELLKQTLAYQGVPPDKIASILEGLHGQKN